MRPFLGCHCSHSPPLSESTITVMINNTLYTLGLDDRSLGDLLTLLSSSEIHTVVDIRLHLDATDAQRLTPDSLREPLLAAGHEYHWAGRQLGDGRAAALNSPHTALTDTTLRGYADFMGSTGFEKAIAQLLHLANLAPTVIVCAQYEPLNCYRSLIADYLTLHGMTVVHLLDSATGQAHMLRPEVRRESAELIYDRALVNHGI